ncbi:MAG: hypothetical protein GXC94_06200 [Comamonadaceae bacterium]|jgi:hypothetical protein|nr:hypothetical protein [Comamonadaceae bacterium]
MNTSRHPLTRWLAPVLAGLAVLAALPAARAADVGVSIGFSQPGFYGRVDVGRYPTPVLVAPQPVIIGRPVYRAEPVYLWVPPGQRRDWRHNCHRYRACGTPVYFVDDGWYRQNVIVHRDRHGHDHRRHDRHDHDRGRGHGRD